MSTRIARLGGTACCLLVFALLSVLPAAPATAAGECRVEYVYHKHVGLGTEDQPGVRVTLDAGQSRTFNQAHLVRVKNTGTHRVKATLDGVLINPVTIAPGGQDPPVGFYADLPFKPPPTLKQLECLAQAGPAFGTPLQLVEALRGTVPVEEIARQLQQQFQQTPAEIARHLKSYFSPAQVMKALKNVFNATYALVAQWMKQAGYTAEQIARALSDLGERPEEIVRILKALGLSVLVVVVILIALPAFVVTLGGGVLPSVAACVVLVVTLIVGGFSEIDAARAVRQVGGNETTIASVYKQRGLPAAKVREILVAVGYNTDQITRALQAAGFSAAEIEGPPRPLPLRPLPNSR